ncbi:histone-lysine N-methyltransferase SETMAR [Trichonephila clavipes]|nr:histone-lysine N-methyltransferase SETMAR [Trichonephila clavipes]
MQRKIFCSEIPKASSSRKISDALVRTDLRSVWVPHKLTEKNLSDRERMCSSHLIRHNVELFLDKLITGDKKWILYENIKRKKSYCKPGTSSATVPKPSIHQQKVLLCLWNLWAQVTREAQTGEIKEKRIGSYWLVFFALLVGGSRCLAVIQHDASQYGKAPFAIVLTSTMGDFPYAENADIVRMVTVELCYECITRSFLIDECRIAQFFSGYILNFGKHVRSHCTRHDTGRRRAVRSPSPEEKESILNVVAERPESSARNFAHHVSVNHQTIC